MHELCTNESLDHVCAHRSRHESVGDNRRHFVGSTVELFQGFALHLQLHLRMLLEDLRVALTKHLSHPLIGNTSALSLVA